MQTQFLPSHQVEGILQPVSNQLGEAVFFGEIDMERFDTEENAIAWAKMVYRQTKESRDAEIRVFKFDKTRPTTPSFIREMRESQYRKGYQYGMIEAANFIEVLNRKGYSRLMEAHNFIWRQVDRLYHWRRSVSHEKPLQTFGEPQFPKLQTWYKLKQFVFKRDGNCCAHCGNSKDLECHHIESVKSGGIAELDNLSTLCKDCHKSEHSTRN